MQASKHYNYRVEQRPVKTLWGYCASVFFIFACLLISDDIFAEQTHVQLIYNNNKTHLTYVSALKYELEKVKLNINYTEISVGQLVKNEQSTSTYLYVAVGVDAADYLSTISPNKTTLYTLIPFQNVPNQNVQRQLGCYPRCIFSVLDQPIKRQINLLRHSLPEAKRIGVLYSRRSESFMENLRQLVTATGLSVVPVLYGREKSLMDNLSSVLRKSDLLLAIPDPEIYNRQTARSIILTSYTKRIPIFGYSGAYTRAGALISLHSSPQQLAKQNAEIITSFIRKQKIRHGIIYPKYFSVTTNQTVARSLRLQLDSSKALTNWLRKHDDISANN